MHQDIAAYHAKQADSDKLICDTLHGIISTALPQAESIVWHAHPVWFIDGNPIVGYSKLKGSVQLLFWSGQSFEEPSLQSEGSFKAAAIRFTNSDEINQEELGRILDKAVKIQWDYKNIVKNRGSLHLK